MNAIELSHVSKTFRTHSGGGNVLTSLLKRAKTRQALKSVSFSVKKGDIVGLIGENGSGKSTLLKIIAGVYPSTEGLVETNGKVLFLGSLAAGFPPRLTVLETIHYAGILFGLTRNSIRRRSRTILELADLSNYRHSLIHELSRGMVHRLAFALVIIAAPHDKPDILLLDEVFTKGGDIKFRQTAKKEIQKLLNSEATIMLSSHDMNLIASMTKRTLWLDKGELVSDNTTSRVCEQYELKNL